MPILLVFALIAACLPIKWLEPLFGPHRDAVLIVTSSAVSVLLVIAFVLRTWVVHSLRRHPSRRVEIANIYSLCRRILFFVNITTVAACVLVFGWGWLVQHELVVLWHGEYEVAPFAEFAVPAPYFVILVGCWFIYYDAERALHHALHRGRRFTHRLTYVFHNLRQFSLMVLLPVSLIVMQQTLGRFAPEMTRTVVYRAGTLAAVPFLLLFMPLVMKPLLGLKSMPHGPVRDRLEALAKRLNFRCTDFLLWPTHGTAVNAMIAGLLPRVRYVVFTDRILEDLPPDELDAVFGHEIGHAKHGHIWLYAAFLILSLLMLGALVTFLLQQIHNAQSEEWVRFRNQLELLDTWLLLPPVVLVASYLFVVFGALSRRCERQADLFGCKAVSCGDSACTGHDETTIYPQGGHSLCPTGIRTFARALERVGDLNGVSMILASGGRTPGRFLRGLWAWIRAWQHSPMPRRVAYLLSLIEHPEREPRFQRRLFLFKCVLMLALAAALVALGDAIGWDKLFESL